MRTSITFLLVFLAVSACDQFSEDVLPPIEVTFETGQEIPFVINPAKFIRKEVSSIGLSIQPATGSVELISNKGFLRYVPATGISDSQDTFSMEIVAVDGSSRQVDVTVEVTDNTCLYESIFDFVALTRSESKSVDLFANDFFCNGHPDIRTGTFQQTVITSDFEDLDWAALVLDESSDEARLEVNAPSTLGIAKIIYEIGINLKNGYEVFFAGSTTINPEAFETYFISEVTIEVRD